MGRALYANEGLMYARQGEVAKPGEINCVLSFVFIEYFAGD